MSPTSEARHRLSGPHLQSRDRRADGRADGRADPVEQTADRRPRTAEKTAEQIVEQTAEQPAAQTDPACLLVAALLCVGCAHMSTQAGGASHDGFGALVSATFPAFQKHKVAHNLPHPSWVSMKYIK